MLERLLKLFSFLTKPKFLFLYAFLVFALLLARNPFSTRTLISNLEPYPDTFHYIVPARNFALGEGFSFSRGFGDIKISVPPLYSFSLVPFFLTNSDPRMYYLVNVLFSLASLYLFYLFLKKITKNRWIIGFSLFLFSTSYYFYWYPQWAMAENLLLPLFLAGIYLLLLKVSKKNILLAAILTVSFYATKYSAAPISLTYAFIYSLKIVFEKKHLVKRLLTYLLPIGFLYLLLQLYINSISGVNHLATFIKLVTSVLPRAIGAKVGSETIQPGSSSWYSASYVLEHFPRYLRATLGSGERFLWDFRPIIPRYLGILGYLGLIWGFVKKKTRFLALGLLTIFFVQIAFASTFYSFDLRFVYIVLPILLIGVFFSLAFLKGILGDKKLKKVFYVCLVGLFSYYLLTNAIRIKDQMVLNLRYSETPWTFISVQRLNERFGSSPGEKPLVISPLPPFYFDYFSNGNYELLPLSPEQEFRTKRDRIWGPGDYSDLHTLYYSRLDEGRELYLSTYGLGVEGYLHSAFRNVNEEFNLIEVYSECFDLCKLYRVEKK